MENTTLQETETIIATKNQELKLIEGKFTKSEAFSILNDIVDAKINFHKIQRLSKTEGNIKDKCVYDNSRIVELTKDKEATKAFLKSLEANNRNIKIASTITITVEE